MFIIALLTFCNETEGEDLLQPCDCFTGEIGHKDYKRNGKYQYEPHDTHFVHKPSTHELAVTAAGRHKTAGKKTAGDAGGGDAAGRHSTVLRSFRSFIIDTPLRGSQAAFTDKNGFTLN